MKASFSSLLLAAFCGSLFFHATSVAEISTNRWEKDIIAFETADKTNAPSKGGIVFIGSSSIRGWKTLTNDFPEHKVINRGFGGSQLIDSVQFADRIVTPYKPKAVVLYAGDNDLNAGKSPEEVANDFRLFVDKIHEKQSSVFIYFIAIKPSIARWHLNDKIQTANKLIQKQCAKNKNLKFVDVYTPMLGNDGKPEPDLFVKDGLHLTPKGYQLWTSVLKPLLVLP